jgi:hypothetical protein
MNQNTATTLINQTFDAPFDEAAFTRLAANLLNKVDRHKAIGLRSGNIIPQAYRGHISTYRRPFVYTDPNGERVDVLIVRLAKPGSLERARTMQRNFIAHYITQLAHDQSVDGVLAAFYHPDVADWRFSLVKLEYLFGEDGAEEKLTPARRYSFLVGPNEPTHTAARQLLPLLVEDGRLPTLDQLTDAFRVEVVGRRFFEAYKELFLRLVEALDEQLAQDPALRRDFERAGIHLPNFAKKLLGQIVFLYFVQKKGWLGVAPGDPWGSGPRDFLRRLFARQDGVAYDNFFDDLLEPLFYRALAIKRTGDRYQIGDFVCQIPFLNGGLFEPMGGYDWQNTHLRLPNRLFSNRQGPHDDQGSGILDVFDRYNFTVWEEEPLEKEVAVDPEMLGQVFENLLEVEDRKSKGAFYTPREIVHYMCQESLINYLDTQIGSISEIGPISPPTRDDLTILVRQGALALQQDAAKEAGLQKGEYVLPAAVRAYAAPLDAALADIRLCDPAIGSGAFPVGMLHEIVQARLALTTHLGDERPDRFVKPVRSSVRSAYELKRHAIQQSIYGVDIDAGAVEIAKLRLWLSLVVDESRYDDIQPLPNLDYKIVQGNALLGVEKNLFNLPLFNRLDRLKQEFFDATHRHEKRTLKAQIDQLIELLTGEQKTFDFEVYFHEVFAAKGGFDVAIGNPPYVRQELIRELKPDLKKRFPDVYAGTADLYVYFYAAGLNILNENGGLAFITSNKFMRAGYGKKLRQVLGSKSQLHAIIDFGDLPVFDATAYPTIVIVRQGQPANGQQLNALTIESLALLAQLPYQIDEMAWPMPQTALKSTGWALARPDVLNLMRKLRQQGTPLEKFINGRFYRGIVTGYNAAFLIDEKTRHRLIEADPRSVEVIKPWLRGRDIKRWRVDWNGDYLIFTRRGIDIDNYPAIKGYLAQFKESLLPKPDDWPNSKKWLGRKSGPYKWYEIQDSIAYHSEFLNLKIVYSHFNKEPNFALETKAAFSNDKTYIIPGHNLTLLAFLNSKVSDFFLQQICPTVRGDYMEFRTIYVGQIPIPAVSDEQQAEMETLVQQLLDSKGQGPQAAAWEQALNQIVYRLYHLTPAEIALIEQEVKN